MIDIYFQIAILILILAVPIAIVGNLVYWNRMSTIPDSISHSSLMIVAFSLAMSLNYYVASLFFILIISFIISFSRNALNITNDATSVFTSQTALSVSALLIFLSASGGKTVSFFIAGSILLINVGDIVIASVLAVLSIVYYIMFFDKLVIIVVNRDIARAEGVNVFLHDYVFLVAVSSLVVVGVKLVGILLVSGLLIIPAMSASLAKVYGIGKAVIFSYLIIATGGIFGLSLSFYYDLHTGPLISISVLGLSILVCFSRYILAMFFSK